MNTRFIEIIQSAGSPLITVVGDLILDSYVMGNANRISPEAPIQVLDVDGERFNLGGAANVAANLKALGARVQCCGVAGTDRDGDDLVAKLEELGIGTTGILRLAERPTVCKTRVISHNQQLIRIDRERRDALSDATVAKLLERIRLHLEKSDAVVVSDYAKGLLTPPMVQGVIEMAGGYGVLVDPKGTDYAKYAGARLITPNKKEAEEFTGVQIHGDGDLEAAAQVLRKTVGVEETVITLGAEGIFFAEGDVSGTIIPARARSVYDVTGAGDTVIAMLAFFRAAGYSLETAVRIGNTAAGIVVGRLGAAAPNRVELIAAFTGNVARPGDKILDRREAARISHEAAERGDRLVFTNGCYDLIHGGHLEFLRNAKAMGDCLMVAVNDDASVTRLKGPARPVLALEERMEILASLQVVDYVTSFSEDTPLEIIQEVTPAILVKGEDWQDKGVVGREWIEEHGGEVLLVKLREGRSTTEIIRKILDAHEKSDHG